MDRIQQRHGRDPQSWKGSATFVRVTRGTGDPSRYDEALRWGNETLVPAFQKMEGFRGYVSGVDRQSGDFIAITYWDTEEQARGIRDSVDSSVLNDIRDLGMQLGAAEVYEVTLQV